MPRHENTVRATALALVCYTQMSMCEIARLTGMTESRVRQLKRTAFARGFDPSKDARIYERFVEDAPRSGRPKEITPIQEQQIIDSATADLADQEKSARVLAYEAGISMSYMLQI